MVRGRIVIARRAIQEGVTVGAVILGYIKKEEDGLQLVRRLVLECGSIDGG